MREPSALLRVRQDVLPWTSVLAIDGITIGAAMVCLNELERTWTNGGSPARASNEARIDNVLWSCAVEPPSGGHPARAGVLEPRGLGVDVRLAGPRPGAPRTRHGLGGPPEVGDHLSAAPAGHALALAPRVLLSVLVLVGHQRARLARSARAVTTGRDNRLCKHDPQGPARAPPSEL
jgi:hypothetical protein